MNIKYKIKEIHSRIFLVSIDNPYDLAMTFCRIQEFYESPFKNIRGKKFSMMEFQKLYSEKYGYGFFTYPKDWEGFNIPCNVINTFRDVMWRSLDDWNEYDDVFDIIVSKIEDKYMNGEQYYIIGSKGTDKSVIDHEVAHAFYYLYPKYKKEVDKIINTIPERLKKKINSWLISAGYSKNVLKDEIQAYLSSDDIFGRFDVSEKEKNLLDKFIKKITIIKETYKN